MKNQALLFLVNLISYIKVERIDMSDLRDTKPWWKQLWPWLLISGPAVAIIGCSITIWLAINLYADKPVREGVIAHGLKVERVIK